MITGLDEQIGRIVAELDKKGLRDNTIILFASDNGGATSGLFASGSKSKEERDTEQGGIEQGRKAPANNVPFSGGKGGLHEGGVRVPAFVNWPAKLKPRVVTEPLDMVDVMPTLLAVAGAKGSPGHPFDGKDMWAAIADGAPSPHEDILINVEAFRGAVRKGEWKLIKIALLPGKTQLFNLAKDPGEATERRRRQSRDRQRPRGAVAGLREGAEAEPLDQGAARFRRRTGQDGHRPGFRHRRQRAAARANRAAGEVMAATRADVLPGSICMPILRPIVFFALAMAALGLSPARAVDAPRAADGSILPFPPVPTASTAGPTLQESIHIRRAEPNHLPADAPNILIVLLDNVGFGLPDTFGGEVHTPTLTRLANEDIAYNSFHTTSICSPTRAALLTGRNVSAKVSCSRSSALASMAAPAFAFSAASIGPPSSVATTLAPPILSAARRASATAASSVEWMVP